VIEENNRICEDFAAYKTFDSLTVNMKEMIKLMTKFKGSKYAYLINDVLNIYDIDNFFKKSKNIKLDIDADLTWE